MSTFSGKKSTVAYWTWVGSSGRRYTYQIHPIGTRLTDAPGNFIFVKENVSGESVPVYVGQTASLWLRSDKEGCAVRNGATQLHVHLSDGEVERTDEQRDLVERWHPPCNDRS